MVTVVLRQYVNRCLQRRLATAKLDVDQQNSRQRDDHGRRFTGRKCCLTAEPVAAEASRDLSRSQKQQQEEYHQNEMTAYIRDQ